MLLTERQTDRKKEIQTNATKNIISFPKETQIFAMSIPQKKSICSYIPIKVVSGNHYRLPRK